MPKTASSPSPENSRILSLSGCVAQYENLHPAFDEHDIAELVEERTGIQVTPTAFDAISADYRRAKLQAWTPESEGTEEYAHGTPTQEPRPA